MTAHEAAFTRKTVPGADGEAIITAVNAVADRRTEFEGNGTLQFDGEVRDAAAGIELKGGDDGVGGTGGDASCAGAATVLFRAVGVKRQGGEDFRQENPVAEATADEIRV